ncbi:ribosome biogenesis GTPase YlqF [Desulfolucanica intricata]|uniref:ribosome biogenesis GTPase YlqF n=1 Tax=Desulfolucanica intricata TaxID=1285191 RepID=UPI000829566D|nr:ribosome biogenesis GTPase YlqF [Desulfolucanica intricata]
MNIQWYPGHMARAKKLLQENLKLVDVAIELLDARIPLSSRNPVVNELLDKKPRLIILNKSDLADSNFTEIWKRKLTGPNIQVVAVDSIKGSGIKSVPSAVFKLAEGIMSKLLSKGRRPRAVRCMVVGIPNVGKSFFINRLVKQKAARTGNRPGVTRGQQWIRVAKNLELLDTPGILWPKFNDQEAAYKLAVTGAIKSEVIDIKEVSGKLALWLKDNYPDVLINRYKLTEIPDKTEEILTVIGCSRGFLLPGGIVDDYKAAVLLLKEFREGLLGRFTLDVPE